MQTCPECGDRNEDGELFCGSCGTYLEWAESQPAPGTAAAAVEEPAADDVAAPDSVSDESAGGQWGAAEPAGGERGAAEPAGSELPAGADDDVHAEVDADVGGAQVVAGTDTATADRDAPAGGSGDGAGDDGAGAAVGTVGAGLGAVTAGAAAGRNDAAPVSARRDDLAPVADGPAPGNEPAPAEELAPAEEPAAAAVADKPRGAGGAGRGLGRVRGGRASSLLRQAADQATGGAASQLGGSASRARSQARNLTGAPGRTAASEVSRAATGAGGPPIAAGAVRHVTSAAVSRPAATTPGPTTPAATKPAATQPGAARPAAGRAGAGGGADAGGTGPRKPAARKPGAPVPRRQVPAASADEPQPQPGDLICGACGAGNAPHRNFCRRCGASLADAPVQPQRSWWRRLLRPERRPGPSAGSRPRNRRRVHFPTRLVVVLVVLGLLVGAGWYFRGPLGDLYQGAVDRVAGDNPVNPAEPTASSALDGRPASQARDGFNNVSWAPVTLGDGAGEWIEFPFDDPFRLVTVVVTAGASPDEDQRLAEARPRDIRLSMTTPGGLVVEEATLDDVAEPQGVTVGVSDVSAVRLTILSAYGENLQAPVAVAEVEFRGR
ncbi:zinc-ribbon domain-containing protein [Georgenia sp. MJ173]|uniref:zinc ribbon domain-containing protein n=1 Tax=Georgenia sunbinii TaxID=3117728 RepID=UPI002F26DCDC